MKFKEILSGAKYIDNGSRLCSNIFLLLIILFWSIWFDTLNVIIVYIVIMAILFIINMILFVKWKHRLLNQ